MVERVLGKNEAVGPIPTRGSVEIRLENNKLRVLDHSIANNRKNESVGASI